MIIGIGDVWDDRKKKKNEKNAVGIDRYILLNKIASRRKQTKKKTCYNILNVCVRLENVNALNYVDSEAYNYEQYELNMFYAKNT